MGGKKKRASKAYQVSVSLNALQNIDEITGYIAFIDQQPLQAIKVGDSILETFDRIAKNPFAFRECAEIPTKTKIYRRALCLSWTIIFRIKGVEIVILGIIHQSRRSSRIGKLRRIK